MTSPYLWIQTRDGSPTLWSNEISEPFRSTKGAFTESWMAFVRPALVHCKSLALPSYMVGEFGLGPGTNWVLWSIASRLLNISHAYHVVEKDLRFFEEGCRKWSELSGEVLAFTAQALARDFAWSPSGVATELDRIGLDLSEGKMTPPVIYESAEHMLRVLGPGRMNVWFHDPFGYAVNPDGYSADTMERCAKLWATDVAGFSYAANRSFKDAIESLGLRFTSVDTENATLKRQRSEFYGAGL